MDKLAAMQLFRRVAETGSFSTVSREVRLAQPTVSKQVAALEEHLGSKLLNRSTRQVNLTEAGETYYQRCCQVLDELVDAEADLQNQQSQPTGQLRIAMPIGAGRIKLLPCLWQFQQRYPQLSLDVHLDDNYVDMLKQGIDVAIRIGELDDSSLVARKLGSIPRYIVASPEYLTSHGQPKTLTDLLQHNCIVYNLLNTQNAWHFTGPDGKQKIQVSGNFSSNSPDAIREAVLADKGIAVLLGWLVEDDIKQGRLKRILPDYTPTTLEIHALYPQRRFMPAKLKLLLEHLHASLQFE